MYKLVHLRAWVAYGLSTYFRLAQIIQKDGGWFGPKRPCGGDVKDECIGDYNEDLTNSIETPATWLLKGLVVLSAILILITCKYRKLIPYFFALECLIRFVAVLLPTTAGFQYNELKYLITFALNFGMYYCGSGYSIIYSTFVYSFSLFYGISMVYNRALNFSQVNLFMACILFYLIFSVCISMIILYLEKINETLS